jgi:hypothetical protein
MKTSHAKHVPSSEPEEEGAFLREAAEQSCGYRMGTDLFTAREQIEAGGGPRAIVQRAERRAERGGK